MSVVVWIGTFSGWAMIGHVVTKHAIRWRRQKRLQRPADEAQKRLQRIARLEIACGVGLKYGEEALEGVGTRFARDRSLSQHDLQSFGSIVERLCWACDGEFTPSDHADWYAPWDEKRRFLSMYADRSNPNRDPLDEVLCPDCLAKARAELDSGIPLP